MKQHIAKLLLASMLLSLASCGGTSPADDTTAADTTPEVTTEASPKNDIQTKDFGGETFTILAPVEQWQDNYVSEETGDVLNDAVYARNSAVEEAFNIKLDYYIVNGYMAGMTTVAEALQGSVMAGDAAYDLFVPCSAYVAARILEGVLSDLNKKENLNFDDPWWFKNTNNELTVDGKLYVCAGGFSLNALSSASGVIFNKEMIDTLKLESPYDLVNSGKWTLDKLMTMAESAYSDLNGDSQYNSGDRFGIIGTSSEIFNFFPYGMGYSITKNDENGVPQLVGTNERVIGMMDKLATLIKATNYYYSCNIDPVVEAVPVFSANQALFFPYNLKVVTTAEMREAPDFGIVPLPKYDEAQERYISECFLDVNAIPAVVKNDEMSQLVLNALNCYTYYDVMPVYKEMVLQRKLTRDNESAEMIDMIVENVTLDFGSVFYSQINASLYNVYQIIRVTSFATWWDANKSKSQANLDSILETIRSFEN
ncbi:MAG: extracellular solute-binding protein [Ruminococcaceae bacterium]|nr:extracellular solute-binding protein [Oscillospiraceae bacterium]